MAEFVANPTDDKFAGLPDIPPDPQLHVDSWADVGKHPRSDRYFLAEARRAFIQALIARHPIRTVEELKEAVKRRFGALPSQSMIVRDLKIIRAIQVPTPLGPRYRLASQYNKADIEDELDERIRIDLLDLRRQHDTLYFETNRGTALALVQLLNLLLDDGGRPGVLAVTTDGDKWVVMHCEDGKRADAWERWLKPKIV